MEPAINQDREMKNYLGWISENYYTWEYLWDGYFTSTTSLDQIEVIEALKKGGRYPQILNLVLDKYNEIRSVAMQAIIEEILETWEKKQWDEVIDKLIAQLHKERS